MSVIWFDFETRSQYQLKKHSAYVYARHPSTCVLALAWALDDGPVTVWSPDWCHPDGPKAEESGALLDLFALIRSGQPYVAAAFNSFFDRHIWNVPFARDHNAPHLPVNRVIDVQAQAEGSACPPGLDAAATALGTAFQKNKDGQVLKKILCKGSREDWRDDAETRDMMRRFRKYAHDDITTMRAVYKASRPLTVAEWDCFQASEEINDRGVAIDIEFAKAATRYAASEMAEINDDLQRISGDGKMSINASKRKAVFVHGLLVDDYPDVAAYIEREPDDKGRARFSLNESTRTALFAALDSPEFLESEDEKLGTVREFLEVVEAGNSAAVKKFEAFVRHCAADGRVHGMYAYNGGGQTGRFSSRGTQTHNLTNDALTDDPNDMIDLKQAIVDKDQAEIDRICAKAGRSVTRSLGLLQRPTFIASEGRNLVWGDWSSIEWVVLPWLSKSRGGQKRLDAFSSGLDPYRLSASMMHKVSYESIPKEDPRRQEGKIAELSLGFLGGAGALMGMAKKYGRAYKRDEAQVIVDSWREANGWATRFGNACMEAFKNAVSTPNTWFPVGRIAYRFVPKLMRGTVVCRLPCGRLIQYPEIKIVRRVDEELNRVFTDITYRKSWGSTTIRNAIWRGILVENATQATANSLLRLALIRFRDTAVFHTHDEIGLEVPIAETEQWVEKLKTGMEVVPDWAEGLPIRASIVAAPFYYKD